MIELPARSGSKTTDAAGLLEEGEWDAMVGGDRHTSVLFWISAQAEQLMQEGLIDDFSLPSITAAVLAMRGKANDSISFAQPSP